MSEYKERKAIEHFEEFLKTFVVEKKSYIRSGNLDKEFTKKDIENVYNSFLKNSKDNNEKDKKFDEVVKDFEGENLEILNHAVFLWGLPNNRKPGWVIKKETKEKNNKGQKNNPYRDMPTCSVGGGGSGYVQTKVKGIRFILYIFTQIIGNDNANAKDIIKNICTSNYTKNGDKGPYGEDDGQESLPDGVKNFLLHLCYPDEYAPIASTSDKKKIVKTFINKVNDKKKEIKEHIDECIKLIKNKIISAQNQDVDANANEESKSNEISITFNETKIEILKSLLPDDEKKSGKFSFYNDKINWLWRGESDGDNMSRVQLLEYKKAMVLYGPPGTGKTYTAMELAKEMLVRYWVKQYENLKKEEKEVAKDKLKDCINNIKKITEIKDLIEGNKIEEKNIYYLQLHVNYSYENFIAGQVIEDNKIVTKKGFIYDVIEKANNKKQEPFVVILDEMNRVDVSRVFGELFTAIEKRNTPVDLTLPDPQNPGKRLTLTIPENIYFIGTMNEIDFSLEQLDFALRRRFIWELADYNSDSLEEIINSRLKDLDDKFKSIISSFIGCCENVNKTIEGHNSLGKEYHIGHAFFAEIAEIIKKHPTNDFMKSKSILWQISILPTLEAYCGTMDSSEKKTFIEDCKKNYDI
jgi:5-methylcytosine-specific restriction protein B